MIRRNMRNYNCLVYGSTEENAYGEPILNPSNELISMAIIQTNQALTNDIHYLDADYIGLTMNYIDDSYVILCPPDYLKEKGTEDFKLKVKYVNRFGRYNQAFLTRV